MRIFTQWLVETINRVSGILSVATMVTGTIFYYFPPAKRYLDSLALSPILILALGGCLFIFASFRAWLEERLKVEQAAEKVFLVVSIKDYGMTADALYMRVRIVVTNTGESPADNIEFTPRFAVYGSSVTSAAGGGLGSLVPHQQVEFEGNIPLHDKDTWISLSALQQQNIWLGFSGVLKYQTRYTHTIYHMPVSCSFDYLSNQFRSVSTREPESTYISPGRRIWQIIQAASA